MGTEGGEFHYQTQRAGLDLPAVPGHVGPDTLLPSGCALLLMNENAGSSRY